jgi:phage terminase large subunit-like protein
LEGTKINVLLNRLPLVSGSAGDHQVGEFQVTKPGGIRPSDGATHHKVWTDQGFITTTEGNFIDHNAIEQEIRALCEAHQVEKIRLEHYGSAQIAANFMGDGLPVEIIHKKPDIYSEPAKLLEAWVEINKFRFDANPVLTWMASNCVVDRRVNGSILPKK